MQIYQVLLLVCLGLCSIPEMPTSCTGLTRHELSDSKEEEPSQTTNSCNEKTSSQDCSDLFSLGMFGGVGNPVRTECHVNLDPLDVFCPIWTHGISCSFREAQCRPRCQSTKRVQQRQVLDLCASCIVHRTAMGNCYIDKLTSVANPCVGFTAWYTSYKLLNVDDFD